MPYANPVSLGLHAIPDTCPRCNEPIASEDERFVGGITDIKLDNGEMTCAHIACLTDAEVIEYTLEDTGWLDALTPAQRDVWANHFVTLSEEEKRALYDSHTQYSSNPPSYLKWESDQLA